MTHDSSADVIGTRWVAAALLAFVLGFALWPPTVLVIGDEARYVSQALALASGGLTLPGSEILYPPEPAFVMSDYPPGTSLLQAPLVLVGGWRAAAWVSVASLVAATALTQRWLREIGYSPAFALVLPGFFGAAFFGRVAMSDVPSAAVVALALWSLWRADGRSPGWSLVAGLSAGASLLFREPNAVLLAPLLVDAVVGKRCHVPALVAGGAIGLVARLGLSYAMFGSAFYVRDSGYGFALESLSHSATPFALILLVMFPLGGLLPLLYQGPRRTAIRVAAGLYCAVFLFYEYDSITENGVVKGLILASRFVVPALPLFALMAADVWPRWYALASRRGPRLARAAALTLASGAVAMAFAVHPAAHRQESIPASIVRAVFDHTTSDEPIVTNHKATLKYLSTAYGPRRLILREAADPANVAEFMRQYRGLQVVLLDRSDSEMFRLDAVENERFLQRLDTQCVLRAVYDRQESTWARLRILRVSSCP